MKKRCKKLLFKKVFWFFFSNKNCFPNLLGYFNGFVLYVLIWWTVLFAVLPLGVAPVAEADQTSGWRGAPARPRIGRKLLITTLASVALWGVCALVITSGWISFRHGFASLPEY